VLLIFIFFIIFVSPKTKIPPEVIRIKTHIETLGGYAGTGTYPHIVSLVIQNRYLGDKEIIPIFESMKKVNIIHHLRDINLSNTTITDKTIEYFSEIPKLQSVEIISTQVVGENFEQFVFSRNLRILDIRNTKIKVEMYSSWFSYIESKNLTIFTDEGSFVISKGKVMQQPY
jgi:hypothetical protein